MPDLARPAMPRFVDVSIFGEVAVVPARRGAGGRPQPLVLGPVIAPRGRAGAIMVAELTPTAAGTLAVRGAMVPHHPFPPGVERSAPAAFRHRPRRAGRYRLSLPRRPRQRCGGDHRPAFWDRQCRRLSFPAAPIAGDGRPHRSGCDTRGPARSAARPAPDRQCRRSQGGAVLRLLPPASIRSLLPPLLTAAGGQSRQQPPDSTGH